MRLHCGYFHAGSELCMGMKKTDNLFTDNIQKRIIMNMLTGT